MTTTPRPDVVALIGARNEITNVDRHLAALTRPGRLRDWALIDHWLDRRSRARRALTAATTIAEERP